MRVVRVRGVIGIHSMSCNSTHTLSLSLSPSNGSALQKKNVMKNASGICDGGFYSADL